MKHLRLGLIGAGSMGSAHVRPIIEGRVPRTTLTAVCDPTADLAAFSPAKTFRRSDALIHSGEVDAVLIATPHYAHTTIGIAALRAGLHVLVEKPISVHKADARKLLAAHTNERQVFAAMFNQRTNPAFRKLRELIRAGEFGAIRRINWIITNWFRTQAYYDSGGWRATWAGEGGGVLLNQCPHNLDLLHWLFGPPVVVQAHCRYGRYHTIEVEDDVTAYLEYPNGATGVFITSTGEAPGTNRLEIAADRGRIVLENDRIHWDRTEVPVAEYCRESSERWVPPPTWSVEVPVSGTGEAHLGILKNFVAAILDGEPLIAPAAEGLHSVELANAMLYSSHLGKPVPLPLNASAYARFLRGKIAASKPTRKPAKPSVPVDMSASFGR